MFAQKCTEKCMPTFKSILNISVNFFFISFLSFFLFNKYIFIEDRSVLFTLRLYGKLLMQDVFSKIYKFSKY